MSYFLLHDPILINAAAVDADQRQVANDARRELAHRQGADGFRTTIAVDGAQVAVVTLMEFRNKLPAGFVSLGTDGDKGVTLALPDPSTPAGAQVAAEMENLPGFSAQLPRALGLRPSVTDGVVSYGVLNVEEIGCQMVVTTRGDLPQAIPGVEALSPEDRLQLQRSAARASQMMRAQAPHPFGRPV